MSQTGPSSLCGEPSRVVSINVHRLPQGESFYIQVQPLWWALKWDFEPTLLTSARQLIYYCLYYFSYLLILSNCCISQWSYKHLFIFLWLLWSFIKDVALLHVLLVASDQESMKSCTSTARDCPVCLQTAVFPVQTNCGHLFCGTTYNRTLFISLEQRQSRHVFVKLSTKNHMSMSCSFLFFEQNYPGLYLRVDMRLNLEFHKFCRIC